MLWISLTIIDIEETLAMNDLFFFSLNLNIKYKFQSFYKLIHFDVIHNIQYQYAIDSNGQ